MSLSIAPGFVGAFGGLNGYWGQIGNEALKDYCDSGVEYVTLAFVNQAPENTESGYPGTNFAGHCWAGGAITEDDVESDLLINCGPIKEGVPYCKERGVKVLLSIGGDFHPTDSNYNVTTEETGEDFAEFLYGAFGPYDSTWNGPRPFDNGDEHTSVDGFDFDIEAKLANKPYIAMINKFRELDSSVIITGAPQCPTDNTYFYMKEMISEAQFDALFIQFYNNRGCDLINDADLSWDAFNYDEWEKIIDESNKSKNAKLYVGLPASPAAAPAGGYVDPETLKEVVCDLKDKKHFGGISLWDLTRGADNVIDGKDYNQHALDALKYGCDAIPTVTSTTVSATSTESTSTEATSTEVTSTEATSTEVTSTEVTSTEVTSTEVTSTEATSTEVTSTEATSTEETTGFSTTASESDATSVSLTSEAAESTSTDAGVTDTLTIPGTFSHRPTGGWNATWTTASTSAQATDGSATLPTTSFSDEDTSASESKTTEYNGGSMTTSTVYTTKVHTVTKCPPEVVDCPEGGYVTTETIPLYTTVCPVTAEPTPTEYETKTVYTTKVHIVTKCPPEVVDCPVGSVTTETVPLYTTVCPVTQTHDETKPSATKFPSHDEIKTVYTTKVHTVTQCPPEVTNCPVGSVSTEVASWTTTIVHSAETQPAKVDKPSKDFPEQVPEEPKVPEAVTKHEAPSPIYSTIQAPPATLETATKAVVTEHVQPSVKQPSGVAVPTGHCTGEGCPAPTAPAVTPVAVPTHPVTAGASSLAVGLTAVVGMVLFQAFAL